MHGQTSRGRNSSTRSQSSGKHACRANANLMDLGRTSEEEYSLVEMGEFDALMADFRLLKSEVMLPEPTIGMSSGTLLPTAVASSMRCFCSAISLSGESVESNLLY